MKKISTLLLIISCAFIFSNAQSFPEMNHDYTTPANFPYGVVGVSYSHLGNGYVFSSGFFHNGGIGGGYYGCSYPSRYAGSLKKVDPNGNTLWNIENISAATIIYKARSLSSTPDEGVVTVLEYQQADSSYACGAFLACTCPYLSPHNSWIKKYSPSGSIDWEHGFPASSLQYQRVSTNNNGDILTIGTLEDTLDLDPGPGMDAYSPVPGVNYFYQRFDSNGTYLSGGAWGGENSENTMDAVIDLYGNIYISGEFSDSMDFDPGPGQYNLSPSNSKDAFLMKIDPTGALAWVKTGDWIPGYGRSIKLNSDQYPVITGHFSDTVDFDPGPGVFNLSSIYSYSAFLVKFDSNGDLLKAVYFQGVPFSGITLDISSSDMISMGANGGSGNGYVDFDPGPDTVYSYHPNGPFIITLDDTLGYFSGTSILDLTGYQYYYQPGKVLLNDLSVSSLNQTMVSGSFYAHVDFDPGPNIANYSSPFDNSVLQFSWQGFYGQYSGCKSRSNYQLAVCDSFIPPSGNHIWDSSGTYYDTLNSATGCDSILIYHLTFHTPPPPTSVSDTICGQYITPGGTDLTPLFYTPYVSATETLNSIGGCDSVVNYLLKNNNSLFTLFDTSCFSILSPSGQFTIDQSGFYQDTIPNSLGCDSIITINFTLYSGIDLPGMTIESCTPLLSPSGNFLMDSSGVFLDTIISPGFCDTNLVVNFTLHETTLESISFFSCDPIFSPSGNQYWDSSGVYLDTLQNQGGCDSILMVEFSLNSTIVENLQYFLCDSVVSPSGSNTYYAPGTYWDTLSNQFSCDSLIQILVEDGKTYSNLNFSMCSDLVSPSGNYIWNEPGTYMDTIVNANGCDSIITIEYMDATTMGSASFLGCGDIVSPSGNHIWSTPGTYLDTISNVAGCDSILTIEYNDGTTYGNTILTECGETVSQSGNQIWLENGTYLDTIPNALGCDSILSVLFTNENTHDSISLESCGPYTSPSGNSVWSTSGIYYDTLQNHQGCDSLLTVDFSYFVNTTNAVIHSSGDTLYADNQSGSFQWLDCASGFLPVPGETDPIFTTVYPGNYALELTENNCRDTSECFYLDQVSLALSLKKSFRVFPNPSTGIIFIQSYNTFLPFDLEIRNTLGQLILKRIAVSEENTQIQIEGPCGLYFISLFSHNGMRMETKILKN